MKRIDTKDGLFDDGNHVFGIHGTRVSAEFLNDIQEEIVNVIGAKNLDGSKRDQLITAIRNIVKSGGGSSSGSAITQADQDKIDSSYQKLKHFVEDELGIALDAKNDAQLKTAIDSAIAKLQAQLDDIRKKMTNGSTETTAGVAEIATQQEANAGTDDNKIVTPKKLKVITSDLDRRATRIRNDVDRNTADLVTHRTDIQQNTTDIVSNTASIATIINTMKKGITTDKLAQSFTVPAVLHDKIQLDGEENTGNYGYSVAMGNNYLAIADPINQEVVIYHRNDNNIKLWNLEDVHRSGKHGDIFVEDGQVYAKRKDGVHLDVFEYDETQTNLTFKKVSTINLTGSFGKSLAIDDEYLIVGNPQASTALIYKHSGIQWQLVEKLSGGTSFGSDVAINHKYVLVSEVANKKAEVYKISRTFDFSAERVTGRFKVNVDVYLNAPTASTTGFIGYTVADDDGVNFYQVVMPIGTTTAYTRTYTATTNGAYATTNINWFYQITDVNALGNINQAKNPRIYFIENNNLYVGVYLEGKGEWALIYKDVSTNQIHTTYSGKKAIRSEIGVIFTEKDFNIIMSRTNRTFYSDTNQEPNKEITDRFYHSEDDSLAYSGNDHAYFSVEEKSGIKKQYNVNQDGGIAPTCFVRIKGLNGVWGGWATANGTRPADPIQLEVLPPTAIKHFKTLTGGASFGKLIDLTDDLSAVAEPDNNILKIYKNLAEIASKTVKADCVSVGKNIVLATSKTDKKAYIYSLLMLHGTGWFTTTKTTWAGIADNANGYTGYNIAGGQYQLVRPVGTTDTYTKYKSGTWVKNGAWGGVLFYANNEIGFKGNTAKVYLDTLKGRHYFSSIFTNDLNKNKTTGRFKIIGSVIGSPFPASISGVVGYTIADTNGTDYFQLIQNLDDSTIRVRRFTNTTNGTWTDNSVSKLFDNVSLFNRNAGGILIPAKYFRLDSGALKVGFYLRHVSSKHGGYKTFTEIDVSTGIISYKVIDDSSSHPWAVVSNSLTEADFNGLISLTPTVSIYDVNIDNHAKNKVFHTFSGVTFPSGETAHFFILLGDTQFIFIYFSSNGLSRIYVRTKSTTWSAWKNIMGNRQASPIKAVVLPKVLKDATNFDSIMQDVAPLSPLQGTIVQANRNLRLTKTDIQEQPNKTGNYVSLLGTGTATTAKSIDGTNFTIDNNFGDACAITKDKVLITNKTDSKLVVYDHKGTKEKEIQLEAGVGSVIDATDTEAIVGSETANTVDVINLKI